MALIEHLDDGIGKVIQSLHNTDQYRNTVIVFTSDNGGQLNAGARNGALRGGKQMMYEGGLKVPFCAVWKNHIQPGSVSDRRALTMDLYPTFCEIAGASKTVDIEGKSILKTLLGQSQPEEARDLYFVRREGNMRYGGKTTEALRRGDWKILQNSPFEPLEMYNLKTDPLEQNDLVRKNTGKYQEMATALRKQIQIGGAIPWQKP